eukprot:TRINITY_DN4252_c0_g1_i2.p1 TRINITY_DN4252_c0_g1~~TRINITY_DN4252_c0_g1_i2.p1  ORF type:complete len:622 (-),score=129.96 TRINITY_DN4252_c0_g1_i2:180-2024(-)
MDENKVIPTVFYRNDKPQKPSFKYNTDLLATEQSSSSSAVSGSSHPSTMSPQLDRSHPSSSPAVMLRPVDHGKLTLQLWFVFQFVGKEKLKSKVNKVLSLCNTLYSKLTDIPSISIITPCNCTKVVFQYMPLKCEDEQDNRPSFLQEVQSPVFVQKVNQQVFNDLVNSTSAIDLDLTLVCPQPNSAPASFDVPYGDHMLFNPLFSPNLEAIDETLIETFISNLSLEIQLIDATLRQKDTFQKLVWTHADLGLYSVTVQNSVGLGAVRYIPSLLLTSRNPVKCSPESPPLPPSTLGKKLQEEIDRLNETIATKLSTKDKSIFQPGKDDSQSSCIILGVDTTPMVAERCQQYLNEILTTASAVEQEFEFSKQIDKILESGIKEAEERIRRENERLEAEQTIFRKIPVFGSVLNWMIPPTPTSLPGNSFNLLTTSITEPSTTLKKSNNIKKPNFESSSLSSSTPVPMSSGVSATPVTRGGESGARMVATTGMVGGAEHRSELPVTTAAAPPPATATVAGSVQSTVQGQVQLQAADGQEAQVVTQTHAQEQTPETQIELAIQKQETTEQVVLTLTSVHTQQQDQSQVTNTTKVTETATETTTSPTLSQAQQDQVQPQV